MGDSEECQFLKFLPSLCVCVCQVMYFVLGFFVFIVVFKLAYLDFWFFCF